MLFSEWIEAIKEEWKYDFPVRVMLTIFILMMVAGGLLIYFEN